MIRGLGHNGPSLASGSIHSEWSWVENFNNGEHWPTVRRLSLLLVYMFFVCHLRAVWFCNYRFCGWQIHDIWEYGVMLPAEELSGFSSPLFHFPPFVFTLRYLLLLKWVNFKLETDEYESDKLGCFSQQNLRWELKSSFFPFRIAQAFDLAS